MWRNALAFHFTFACDQNAANTAAHTVHMKHNTPSEKHDS